MTKITLDITGMHCASCGTLISKRLEKVDGVKYSNVNLTTEKATVDFDEKRTSEADIVKAINSLGYVASICTGQDIDKETNKRNKEIKKLKHQLIWGLIFAIPSVIIGMVLMW